jgi:hypothetical protein
MSWQPVQDVFQVGERIDLVTLVASHKAIQFLRHLAQPFNERATARFD